MTADGSASRRVAARAVMAVLDQGRALDAALPELLSELGERRDRALARRLCHGVLRDWPALNHLIGQLLQRPLARRDRAIHFLLAVALSELRDGREPERAVVHAAVAAARSIGGERLTGLVNGVLRNFQRRRGALEAGLTGDPVLEHGYPGWLIDQIERDWPDCAGEILVAGNRAPPLWLRVNRRRTTRGQALELLEQAGFSGRAPAQWPDAIRLDKRAAIGELPGMAEGWLSVQDAAAQLAVAHLRLAGGERVLDACAAPGGKTAHILEHADVDMTALDIDAERVERIRRGLERLGLAARVISGDATRPGDWWDGAPFDRILIDAPCSATGVIRRHPDIRWLRRARDLESLVALQRALLDALWPLLKPDGILVYATCSVLSAENTVQARSFLERHADARPIDNTELPGRPVPPGRQILPGDDDCDGFYYFAARRLPE